MIEYIAGFFDADGSILLSRVRKSAHKTVVIDFSNTDLSILEEIRDYLGGGVICKKRTYKPHHIPSYTLKFTYRKALDLAKKLLPYVRHTKRKAKLQLVVDRYLDVTPRNGKYSPEMLKARMEFEEQFAAISKR